MGNGISKNIGIDKADGEIILILDDHVSIPDTNFLASVENIFKNTNTHFVTGRYESSDIQDYNYLRDIRREVVYEKNDYTYEGKWVPLSAVVCAFKASLLKECKFPNFSQYASEDTFLQFELEQKGYVNKYCPELFVFHDHDMSFKDIRRKMLVEVKGVVSIFREFYNKYGVTDFKYIKHYLDVKLGWIIAFLTLPVSFALLYVYVISQVVHIVVPTLSKKMPISVRIKYILYILISDCLRSVYIFIDVMKGKDRFKYGIFVCKQYLKKLNVRFNKIIRLHV